MKKNMNLIAQTPLGNITGEGPLGLQFNTPHEAPLILANLISIVIGFLTLIASIYFIFIIIIGAIGWMSAGGDKGTIEQARKKLTNGLTGLVIVVSAIFLLRLVGTLLALPLISNPANLIYTIAPIP